MDENSRKMRCETCGGTGTGALGQTLGRTWRPCAGYSTHPLNSPRVAPN
jgi:hypothetical protein